MYSKTNTQKYQKPTAFSGYPEFLQYDSKRTRLVAATKRTLLIVKKSNLNHLIKIIEKKSTIKEDIAKLDRVLQNLRNI